MAAYLLLLQIQLEWNKVRELAGNDSYIGLKIMEMIRFFKNGSLFHFSLYLCPVCNL